MLDIYLKRSKAYKRAFSNADAQEMLKYLAVECGAYTTSFDKDPLKTAFNEGKRHVFLHIMGIINQNSDLLQKAVQAEQENMALAQMIQQEETAYGHQYTSPTTN